MYHMWKSQLFDIHSNDSKNNISNHECFSLPVDSSEQFLEMCLYNTGVGGLAKNLQQIVISNEIKPRE